MEIQTHVTQDMEKTQHKTRYKDVNHKQETKTQTQEQTKARVLTKRQYCNLPKGMEALHSLTLGNIIGLLYIRYSWKGQPHTSLYALSYFPSFLSLQPL